MSEVNSLHSNNNAGGMNFYFGDDPWGGFPADCRLLRKSNAVLQKDFWFIERNRKIV